MTDENSIRTEEVDSVPTPPRARVEEEQAVRPHKADYLEGFLAAAAPAGQPSGEPGGEVYEAVITALKEIFDPEIPVNIYDLGLIYGVDITGDGHTVVTMTLTTPHCPVAESMPGEVEMRVAAVPGVGVAEVNLIWDPPWDPAKMSDEAKLELGML